MTERLLDLAEREAHLNVRNGLLRIAPADGDSLTLPLDEIAVMVVAHPRITLSHSALARLAEAGGVTIVCDSAHLPVGMLMPLANHHVQAERFRRQARATLPTCKRLWAQVVRAKVRAQGNLLAHLHDNDGGLHTLLPRIRSGDPSNVEARAARRYWPLLFDDPDFRRRRKGEDQNRLLNYGYAVLRAITARAVCAAGLHPSLGFHHHNRYNAFCLADDIMEPFRPLVDGAVVRLVGELGADAPLDTNAKQEIIGALMGRFELEGESRTLFDILGRVAASLAAVFDGKRKTLVLPDL